MFLLFFDWPWSRQGSQLLTRMYLYIHISARSSPVKLSSESKVVLPCSFKMERGFGSDSFVWTYCSLSTINNTRLLCVPSYGQFKQQLPIDAYGTGIIIVNFQYAKVQTFVRGVKYSACFEAPNAAGLITDRAGCHVCPRPPCPSRIVTVA